MSSDEEEDELQKILEGRDVDNDYHDNYHRNYNVSDNEDNDRRPLVTSQTTGQSRKAGHKRKHTLDTRHDTVDAKQTSIDRNFDRRFDDMTPEEPVSGTALKTNEDNETKVKVKVRRLVTKRQPLLNADKLMSREGIAVLPQLFKRTALKGKGSELKDLNEVMFRLTHWSHRLFPSLTFDDFIEKCEQLGHKKALKNFIYKMRLDDEVFDDQCPNIDDDNDNEIADQLKDFDDIIANTCVNRNITYEKAIPQMHTMDTMDSDFDDDIEDQLNTMNASVTKASVESEAQIIKQQINETIDDMIKKLETNESNVDLSDEDMLSEDQILREINSSDD